MSLMSLRAARGDGKKYATNATDCDHCSSGKLYILAQCVPDLTENDCNLCLLNVISHSVEDTKIGGRSYLPSCNAGYEVYPFFNGALDVLSPPPPSPSVMVNITSPSPPNAQANQDGNGNLSTGVIVAIVASAATILIALLILGICLIKTKAKKKDTSISIDGKTSGDDISLIHSIQYDLDTLQTFTNNFSEQNKLGQGGFGAVYKDILENGKGIAVKRLSKTSGEGVTEFKTEVLLVAKLQHKNLVKLLGFCVESQEYILVYEYLPNSSLDKFIFDPNLSATLDWHARLKITIGVVRGLLYLHEDPRLKVIHRDLKTINILLIKT